MIHLHYHLQFYILHLQYENYRLVRFGLRKRMKRWETFILSKKMCFYS